MEQHGRHLARWHQLSTVPGPEQLLDRLSENEVVLIEVCNQLTQTVKANRPITPASEWLLDNFYLIEEQIRTAKRHLPKGYSRQLPRLQHGPSAGRPRVYDIALETISHGDGRLDQESLSRFVAAYQTIAPLNLGELWAIPIMLRLALIENLRRVAGHIGTNKINRDIADGWADQMMDTAENDPKGLILVIADMARSDPPMVSSFVAELARRLQGQSPALALPLTWIEQQLSENGLTIERMVQSETENQAIDQVSISNSITSLRLLGSIDWRKFVSTSSAVEHTLRGDPRGVYGQMNFATQDHYRHVVEKMAKNSRLSEVAVAKKAVDLATSAAAQHGEAHRSAHVGFYLVSKGVPQMEAAAAISFSTLDHLRRGLRRFPLMIYLGLIFLLSVLCTGVILAVDHAEILSMEVLVLVGAVLLLCTSQLAVAFTNWLFTMLSVPDPLPRLDFSKGIPEEFRTLVVVPTLITSPAGIESLIEALEVRFLANQDENLHFALLTDFADAESEQLAGDELLTNLIEERINKLNEKYSAGRNDKFFLFHRPRKWNSQQEVWMAYERKRGKLGDLNAFLVDGAPALDRFSLVVGNTAELKSVKYVLTLDTDTQLPRDAARQSVEAMAHPLNRPYYDERLQRVCDGYGILQQRVCVSLPGTNRSRYARIYGNEPGIDPYTRAVSDLYQDAFLEGSFIGKGIYDVEAFERSLKDRFPENRILSHDLLEGCYARSGLLSDVQLYEEYPTSYLADVSRRRRWIRGDWQLLEWLMPRVPGAGAEQLKNGMSGLSRWKIVDNLRRSLIPIAMTLMFLLSWVILTPSWFWTASLLAIILIPHVITAITDMIRRAEDVSFRRHSAAALRTAISQFKQTALGLAFLPYEASYSLDAISRTLWRMLVSRKNLLEWNPFDNRSRSSSDHGSVVATYMAMSSAPILACAILTYLLLAETSSLPVAGPILVLWFASPALAWWISQPLTQQGNRLTPEQTNFLRKLSRKTWSFFETFVGPADNWLPPDNYQEHPVEVVAHRVSPTNMGLALLSNLAAFDFGYITLGQVLDRTENAFVTMLTLDRHRGHFYNWYDTQSLQPLLPVYISSVDSGNLSGHLLTLSAGLLALPDEKVLSPRLFEGLEDTLDVLLDTVPLVTVPSLAQFKDELAILCSTRPTSLKASRTALEHLVVKAVAVRASLNATAGSEAARWSQSLFDQCSQSVAELHQMAPWTASPELATGKELDELDKIPTLRSLSELGHKLRSAREVADAPEFSTKNAQFETLLQLVDSGAAQASQRIEHIQRLALQSSELADADYEFLFDKSRLLLSIGYNVSQLRLDTSFYDLLASEARLGCFVAIAQGQLPQESWFALGRLLATPDGDPVLLSWSGSMFEYLMPLLVMPTYENTLLDQTYKATVARQIEYGRERNVPWGISESGYHTVDVHLNYQYRAFGVPGLGLKRGLADDLVIAPYASAMALMVAPEESCLNLQRLSADGFVGRYGLYEAIDYTPSRIPRGQPFAVVRSFMAHHEGMSFLSLAYLLLDRPMQKRFEADPTFQATSLLLQERVPKLTPFHYQTNVISALRTVSEEAETPVRIFSSPDTAIPEVQLLSNGRYHVVVTNAGGGFSRWKDTAVTRWREDTTCDNWGTFCYIRDSVSGEFWSNSHQPTLKRSTDYEAIFSEARAEFRRRDHDLVTHTEIVVSSEDDIELRRLTITNRSKSRRTIDVTSYAEVVLAPQAADAMHPAFSNLFVQTEIIDQHQAILCQRRPRSEHEHSPWMFHLMAVHGADSSDVSYETDRMQFIGRGHTIAHPVAMDNLGKLSCSQGSVIDPIVSIRHKITLEPNKSVIVNLVTGIGESRDACLELVRKYHDRGLADRVFDLSWTHSQVVLRQINATESDTQLYGRLASSVIYANPSLRADASVVMKNTRGQSGLWGYAISGDLPIVLLQIKNPDNIDLVKQLVQAHAYWRLKGLSVDLVIWNEHQAGYRQLLQEQIMGLIAAGVEANAVDKPGGIFVRPAEQISSEDRVLFQSVARVIISDSRGTLSEQLNRRGLSETRVPLLVPSKVQRAPGDGQFCPVTPWRDLILFNGIGGFTRDGREYVISTDSAKVTPAPWVNVLANPNFGTVVSENGVGYTWSQNAHEYRLTPWHNDPVTDSSGEAFYIRDEETGNFWSPTPSPARGNTPYDSRHGHGYSVFEHTQDGITSEMLMFVALDAPIKFVAIKLKNESGRPRRISVTGYVEWVLGDLRSKSTMHVITEIDSRSGAIFARNAYNSDFADRTAFFDVDETTRTVSCDRNEFIGRNGTLRDPAAMRNTRLSGKLGAGLDPCTAIQVVIELAAGDAREIVFRLGAGRDANDANSLVHRFRGPRSRHETFEAVCEFWKHTLGAVNVDTPDVALNMLTNGWLVYQTMACRLWGRSGYYQSGGAFGFRDQLQDVMALIHTQPQLLRSQLLLCASRQFVQGDVQHWWHPPTGRGVRTHISDDYLWLPLATCRYVAASGDTGVLDESVPFLSGRMLNAEEESYYDLPNRSDESSSLYEHCIRAINNGLRFGEHGLPLMGTGDWNDGMNLVGERGQGESVWLGFFLYHVLTQFVDIATQRGDTAFVLRCRTEAENLRKNIEAHGWDGDWYRRAYFDDGTPLGTASGAECQIDSISQSWAILSGASDEQRSRTAMESVDARLVRRDAGIIQLLD